MAYLLNRAVTLLLFATFLFSCKGEHTCVCVTKIGTSDVSFKESIIKDTKSKAQDACEEMSSDNIDLEYNTAVICRLK